MAFINYFQNQYVVALLIFVAFLIIAKVVVWISQNVLLKLAKKTKTKLDDDIVIKTNKPISWFLVLIGLRIAVYFIGMADITYVMISRIVDSLIILMVAYIITIIVYILIDYFDSELAKKSKSNLDDALVVMFRKVAKFIIFVIAVIYILSRWDIEIGPILASLGVAGVAVAFALQNTLGNIFGGVSLLMDKSVKVGDRILLESGDSGIVQDVSLRSTRIRNWDNDIVIVPNGQLSNSRIINHISKDRKARVTINFGVEYGVSVDKVEKVVLEALGKVKNCMKDPLPAVDFFEMGDSALLFKARFWVPDISGRYAGKVNATKSIYNALNKAKIVIPYPQMDIHINENS